MRGLLPLLLAVVVLTVPGCSAAPARQEAAVVRPEWTRRVPESSAGNLHFVGLASGAGSLEEGRRRSRHEAYGQVGEYLGQEIRLDYRIERSVTQSGSSPALTRTVVQDVQKAIVDQVASRAKVQETFEEYEQNDGQRILNVWTLVTFPIDESGRVLVDAIDQTRSTYESAHVEGAQNILDMVAEQLRSGR